MAKLYLIASFVLALSTLAAPADKTSPFVVVSKQASADSIVLTDSLTITVNAINIGENPAFDVELVDLNPLDLTDKKDTKVAKLSQGENITLTYTIIPNKLGVVALRPAEVTYVAQAGDSSKLYSYSNFVREQQDLYRGENDVTPSVRGFVAVLTADEYNRRYSNRVFEAIVYCIITSLSIAFPYFIYRSKKSQVDNLLREAKRK